MTMMGYDFNRAMKGISIIREQSEKAILVTVGVYLTVAPEEVASNPDIDYVIIGQREISFVNVLENIRRGVSQGRVLT